MIKKSTFLKTLLVAAGLLVGVNGAWGAVGDKIYSNDFSTKDQTDFATWLATGKQPAGYSYVQLGRAGSFSIATGALVNTPETSKTNSNVYNGNFGTFTEAITTATKTTNYVLSFDITLSFLQHLAYNSIFEISGEDNKTILCLYASHARANSASGSTSYGYIVGGNNAFSTKEASVTDGKKTNTEGSWGDGTKHEIEKVDELTGSKTYHVVLDAQTFGGAKLTIKEGETTVVEEEVELSAETGIKYMYLTNCNSKGSQVSTITLDNLSIVEGAATVAATDDYTVKYVADIAGVETEIKASATRTGVVGKGINLTEADKKDIVYEGVKYLYSADDASEKTIAEGGTTVVKVTFTEAPSYTYSVTDNLGNTIASGNAYKGDNVDFYVPYYVFKDGKFYKSPSLSSGSLSYAKSTISTISANTEITVTYTEEENTNVVFFSEAENLTSVTVQNDGYTQIRMSNGKAGYYTAQTAFANLPAGTYTLTAATRSGETTFYVGTVGEGSKVLTLSSSGAVIESTSAPFVLTGATDIYTSIGSETKYFDYVIIRRIGDAVVPVDIKTTGTTFASAYAINCAKLPDGVKAYKIETVAEKKATAVEVIEAVAAGTGLILIAETADSYDIPVVATGTDITATNMLVGVTADKTIAADEAYGLSGGKFVKLTAGTIKAGKAYLPAASVSAPELTIDFGGVTGIADVRSKMEDVRGEYFNIAGQRVAQPTKGLYIVNGKKIVIK